jgi:hypothetical protein
MTNLINNRMDPLMPANGGFGIFGILVSGPLSAAPASRFARNMRYEATGGRSPRTFIAWPTWTLPR